MPFGGEISSTMLHVFQVPGGEPALCDPVLPAILPARRHAGDAGRVAPPDVPLRRHHGQGLYLLQHLPAHIQRPRPQGLHDFIRWVLANMRQEMLERKSRNKQRLRD